MRREQSDSVAASFGKVVFGVIVGFELFLLATGFGRGGRGEGSPTPPSTALPVSRPPRPSDDKRLSFVMIEPNVLGQSMRFRLRDGDLKKTYVLDELITRVKAGGRTDVELLASGAVIHGAWDEALNLIKRAGLTVWRAEPSPFVSAHVGAYWRGNVRGQYGRRSM
jgi:hypothetical protein